MLLVWMALHSKVVYMLMKEAVSEGIMFEIGERRFCSGLKVVMVEGNLQGGGCVQVVEDYGYFGDVDNSQNYAHVSNAKLFLLNGHTIPFTNLTG